MNAEKIAEMVARAIEGDYPDASITAHVDSDPSTVWIEVTDSAGATCEFRLTVEAQP